MKKLLAVIITLAMLSSLVAAFAIPASAAVDGEWIVYSRAGDYVKDPDAEEEDLEEEDLPCIPGYEYTEEGLSVIPCDWKDGTPGLGVQTKNKVDLKDGVYMLVRVDDFTFLNDKWFCVNIHDRQYVSPGSTNVEKYGQGVQTLIRPDNDGKISHVEWYYGVFQWSNRVNMSEDAEKYDENGKVLIALTITWNGASYAVDINGSAAPETTIAYMNEKWGTDSEAYIGFNMHNSNKGGTASCTVLAFGTSKADATMPMGDDSREPENNYKTIAEIADPSTIEEGKPGVFINGSKQNSDVKSTAGKSKTDNATLNDDYSIHYVADRASMMHSFNVKNSVSYSIDDFPVVCVLTRNLCTCGTDGNCYALESANLYLMTGEIISASDNYKINEMDMCYDPIVDGDDTYLYFYTDMSDEYAPWDAEGRINGLRFDPRGIQYTEPGYNSYDICWIAFFRSVDDIEPFIYEWTGIDPNAAVETTETEEIIETVEVVSGEENTDPAEIDTEEVADTAENDTAKETEEAGNENETEPKTENETKASSAGGCGSSVGLGVAVAVAVAACGAVTLKKKE